MITRTAKILLVAGIALFYTLLVFNNLTISIRTTSSFTTCCQWIRPSWDHGMWRALPSPALHLAFYLSIIAWEIVTMILLWWGVTNLLRASRRSVAAFQRQSAYRWWL